ncbi:uncharacterized protein LOC126976710 [Leptidea sinapis]|uniref:uncharacterized protein LOC126976710 n=1 Tax=Leptidea sinapis TaxID=189913 RepID=UPI0021C2F66F|nr:uncharacterized protein LOC126976710 [Leptidea sinapis]
MSRKTRALTKVFHSVNKFCYIFGLPNYSKDNNINMPQILIRYNSLYVKFINALLIWFVGMECSSFFTQKDLSNKQYNDMLTLGLSHIIIFFEYINLYYKRREIRDIIEDLTVTLKAVHHDREVEAATLRQSRVYSAMFVVLCSSALVSYGLEAFVLVMRNEGTFTTVVTAWPDVSDGSPAAGAARMLFYILWWIFMLRCMAFYLVVILPTIYLSDQYRNVQSYFTELVKIFEQEGASSETKQMQYEDALKVGIQLHMDTLRCTKKCQSSFKMVYSAQIIINIGTLALVMIRMMTSEHTLMNAVATGIMGSAILTSTGIFMWNLGDVTVEASKVSQAMYCSGWENCVGTSSCRVRKLLRFGMMQAQVPVIIRGLGVIELSYTSYVSIVKTSYSIVSVFY